MGELLEQLVAKAVEEREQKTLADGVSKSDWLQELVTAAEYLDGIISAVESEVEEEDEDE